MSMITQLVVGRDWLEIELIYPRRVCDVIADQLEPISKPVLVELLRSGNVRIASLWMLVRISSRLELSFETASS